MLMDTFVYPQISIHAPTRGATDLQLETLRLLVFQSTLPQGERPQTKLIN